MSCLFITGSTGFIGRRLLRKIDAGRYERIFCLSRSAMTAACLAPHPDIQLLYGGLCDAAAYEPYLARCDTVLHMAAATGKKPAGEYFDVNVKGTRFLIEQCVRAGIRNLIFVSTIAVKYPDKSGYYYAESKQLAEQAIQNSSLAYVIVRPTIVIGANSAMWKSICKIARAPITLMFGGGAARIQPIYVDDLIDCLLTVLYEDTCSNEIIELGGPTVITFRDFFTAIQRLYRVKQSLSVPIPSKALMPMLAAIENRFPEVLPVSVGQLAAFHNDGTIDANRIFLQHAPDMKNIDEMLAQVIAHD